nr:MAG TPA: hypothetical protein [Caudoviricetes sp.]
MVRLLRLVVFAGRRNVFATYCEYSITPECGTVNT